MRVDLSMCTPEHVKGAMSPIDHARNGSGVSLCSGYGDRGLNNLGFSVDTLIQTRRNNSRMANKEKGSSVSSGKLVTC